MKNGNDLVEKFIGMNAQLNTKQQAVFISEIIQRLRPELAAFLDEADEESRGLLEAREMLDMFAKQQSKGEVL